MYYRTRPRTVRGAELRMLLRLWPYLTKARRRILLEAAFRLQSHFPVPDLSLNCSMRVLGEAHRLIE